MINPEILFLKQEDVIKAGLLDMKNILEITEYTFKMLGEGNVIQPNKIFLGMPNDQDWTSYGMSMPAYIGGEYNVVGFKWAAESVYNATQPGMPYGIDVVLISDPKTMYPQAIMDGTIITAMRTSAAAGVCAKYNARKNSKIATLVGAGVIGRTMIMAIGEAVPSLEEIRIVDLELPKAQELAREFEGKYNVVAFDNTQKAVEGADLVVTETTARKPFIPKGWLKKNATVIQMEMCAFEEDIPLAADKIVLDSWGQLTHLAGHLIKRLHESGKVNEGDIIELKDLATGKRKGRENDEEFVFCCTGGMGCVDVSIAYKMFLNAKEKGIGTKLQQWDNPLWV